MFNRMLQRTDSFFIHFTAPSFANNLFVHYIKMDFERWVSSKIESLKMKTMAENSRMPIPKKVLEKVSKCDPNEKNAHGESIMISVVRYINDEMRQVSYFWIYANFNYP